LYRQAAEPKRSRTTASKKLNGREKIVGRKNDGKQSKAKQKSVNVNRFFFYESTM
jgi:hypothetical protein